MNPTSKESTSPVTIIFIILAGLVGGYLYYSQIVGDTLPQIPATAVSNSDSLVQFKEVHFDASIFNNSQFQALRVFGESPVNPGQTGRADIFAPF